MSVKLGHFDLNDQIGQGGMGTVFSAFDPTLNRKVAIKVLDEELAQDEKLVQDFFREAQNAAAISHPHIVPVYFVGQDGGHNYMVMELLNGRPLSAILQEGPLPEAQALRMAIEITEALKAGYTNQMIHGDIKPANIFLTNEHGAKLLDFGLAKLANVEVTNSEGGIWGSAYYISPERVGQKAEDFRSDIYSLGATLFEALVGKPPFDAPGVSELASKRLHEKPPMLRTLNPNISKRTERMVNKMLAKSPIMRYLDHDSLLVELRKGESEAVNGTAPSADTTEMFRTSRQIPVAAPRKSANPLKIMAYATGTLAVLMLAAIPVVLSRKNAEPQAASQPKKIAVEVEPAATPAPVRAVAAATPLSTPKPAPISTTPKPQVVATANTGSAASIPLAMAAPYGTKNRQFRYHNPDAKAVSLMGNFNKWTPEPMKMDKNGFWFMDKTLPRNVAIEYQYIVDGETIPDPWGAIPKQAGPNGTMKSVYTIPEVDPTPKPATATSTAAPGASVQSAQPLMGQVDLTALANTPAEWPRAVTLKAPATFTVTSSGQTGEIQAPTGQHVTLKKVEPTQVTVEWQNALQTVPISSTDLVDRVLTARAKQQTAAATP